MSFNDRNLYHIVGVYAYAVCCRTNKKLTCKSHYGNRSGPKQGDRSTGTCEPGYTMMSCNVFAEYAGAAGSQYEKNRQGETVCVALNGKDHRTASQGVMAVFICCKL